MDSPFHRIKVPMPFYKAGYRAIKNPYTLAYVMLKKNISPRELSILIDQPYHIVEGYINGEMMPMHKARKSIFRVLNTPENFIVFGKKPTKKTLNLLYQYNINHDDPTDSKS
jgi:hypothetical protein